MKQYCTLLFSAVFLGACSAINNIEVFTHPNSMDKIPIYTSPNDDVVRDSIPPSLEAGWVVYADTIRNGYIHVVFDTLDMLSLQSTWLRVCDVGLYTIDYYTADSIPCYKGQYNIHPILWLRKRYLVNPVAIGKHRIKIHLCYERKQQEVWINRNCLCGNPYTTCN